ncbi:protein-L-isoaspartate(D-aspartate) O-methyltransferase [Thiohalocapsa sp.]|jgi:protein-L-isoaspartate(D-aspartate) O-methyltransferase|uniref:protein-L-isoaspartate(D-aspartate) O-methyltransferase n=1 Tax=Thiohalocapsa sp. TaxID=2497641 RepID=UPI0025EFB84F|nr:protein-L-isoaspartate(D-aspartate) O-methyltransferase [Thiohalocapsa sp.]
MSDHPDRTAEREHMLETIGALFRLTARDTGVGAPPPDVIEALRRVPRHRFVPPGEQRLAYADMPLPIGQGQTISQPYMVALMTALLEVGSGARVLEIGTGCGYQTAVLAELVAQVYSLEVVKPLAEGAARRLAELGYGNVEVRHGDGYAGWPEQAPFDGIIVTAAAPRVPMTLVRQLKPGANLVIPVTRGPGQVLCVLCGKSNGGVNRRDVLPVAFVPMVRGQT